ncbi:hypothetical protein ACS6Y5_00570 [Streptococcus suis]|nr:hypothetical protein [Streptococcus suis]HEM6489788.1 hypothetical protein [Streptococcus suis]
MDQAKKGLRGIYEYILLNFYIQQSADSKLDLILTALETLETLPEHLE